MEVHPNCEKKQETLDALKLFGDKKVEWTYQVPSDNNDHGWIFTEKNLVEFLSSKDQINAIQNYLVEKLEELHIKKDYPELKWA